MTSQLEGGAYRVMPDQRVNFQHGSLREVVDHEPEPCGCPTMPVTSVASTGIPGRILQLPGKPVGGPSSTPADTAFPDSAERRTGAASHSHATPVVPAGQTHAQVTVPLTYNGENPRCHCSGRSLPHLRLPSPAPRTPVLRSNLSHASLKPHRHPLLSHHRCTGGQPRSRLLPNRQRASVAFSKQNGSSSIASAASSPRIFGLSRRRRYNRLSRVLHQPNPVKDEGVFLLWRFLPHRCARA